MHEREIYAEQRVANERPSVVAAYLLWFLLGYLGAHRFYLRRHVSALGMLLLAGIGTLTAPVLIGWIPLLLLGLWWVIDLFLIPGIIREDGNRIRREALLERGHDPL